MDTEATAGPESSTAGPTFRAARQGAGVSLRALALEAGISHPTLSRWERGQRAVSHITYVHLTRTLADYLAKKVAA
jgi:transcriptional regulator with XRE-family HTH domain